MKIFEYKLAKFLEAEREQVFLWIPVVFALGISVYFMLPFEPSVWWSLAVIEILIVAAWLLRTNLRALNILGWFALFVLGFVNIQVRAYHLSKIPSLSEEKVLYLKGYVEQTGYNYRGKKYFILSHAVDFDNKAVDGNIRITPLSEDGQFETGDCVETVASLRPLSPPNMVGAYQFNRRQFFEGIKATGYTDVSVRRTACEDIGVRPGVFYPLLEKLRAKIVGRIYSVLAGDTAAVTAAVAAGERGKISSIRTREYRDAGLAHFLAISGLHMGMIAGLMFLLVRQSIAFFPVAALKYDGKKIAAVIAIVIGFAYLAISGWQVSTQRAFIMTALILSGVLVNRRAISMRMIAWAALIMLIFEPQVLLSAGFQMSFAAVVMLVAFYEKYAGKMRNLWHLSRYQHRCIRLLRTVILYLFGIAAADFIASMATLPFVIYHFNRVSLYTSLANLLAGPVIGLWVMPAVLASLLLMPLGLDKYLLLLAGKGIDVINEITHYVAEMENASLHVLSMPPWGLCLIVVGGLWLALWQSRWRHGGWLLLVMGFASILTVNIPDVLADNNAKTFAVKAEDGRLIILPNRGNYFTKQAWSEKLAPEPLAGEDKNKLQDIYKGGQTDKTLLDMECQESVCVYKGKVRLLKTGGIWIDGKDFSAAGALAVYDVAGKAEVITVRDTIGERYWNSMPPRQQ